MSKSPLLRLWLHNKSWRKTAFVSSVYSFLNKLFDIAPEILIGLAVDLVVKREQSFISTLGFVTLESQLIVLGIATFVIWVLESLFEYLYMLGWRNLAQQVQHSLRVEGFERSVTHDLEWFESGNSGYYQSILNEDVNQLERFLDGGINDIIQVVVSTVLVSLVFFYLSPIIAIVALFPIPLILLCSRFFQKKLLPLYSEVRVSAGSISRGLSGIFRGIATVKSFSMEKHEVTNFARLSKDYVRKNEEAIRVSSAFTPVIRVFVLTGFLFTLIYGATLTFQGVLEAGSYSVLVFLTQRLLWPFTRLGETIDLYQRAMASTNRIMDLVQLTPKTEIFDLGIQENINTGSVEFKSVSFSYGKLSVIKNVSFEISDKKFVGIVGATGSGKTTLAKILLGFYKPKNGEIYVDGKDISKMSSNQLRSSISYVGQDIFLFDGSLKENLTYGSNGISDSELEEVLKLTMLNEFIENLADGLTTQVGENGIKLSGGQRQRVALTRALLKESKILVLDEATSAVDNKTELFIKKSLDKLRGKVTILSIAHRLSTIRNADKIFVLDDGAVIDSGSHDQLLRECRSYKKLWDIQTGSYDFTNM